MSTDLKKLLASISPSFDAYVFQSLFAKLLRERMSNILIATPPTNFSNEVRISSPYTFESRKKSNDVIGYLTLQRYDLSSSFFFSSLTLSAASLCFLISSMALKKVSTKSISLHPSLLNVPTQESSCLLEPSSFTTVLVTRGNGGTNVLLATSGQFASSPTVTLSASGLLFSGLFFISSQVVCIIYINVSR